MNEERGYYIPEEIILFEKNDEKTFTKKINQITYKNENGNIVRESKLDGDKREIDNSPVKRFIINKSELRVKNEYSAFYGVTLYDEEREFEFEISATNFINLSIFGSVEKGSLIVECIFAFGNKGYPILLPIESVQYQKAKKFTQKRSAKFNGELVPGRIYSMKKTKDKIVYLGKYNPDTKIERYGYEILVARTENRDDAYVNIRPGMKNIFAQLKNKDEIYGSQFLSASKMSIFEEEGDVSTHELNSLIDDYKKENTFFGLKSLKMEKFNDDDDEGLKFYSIFEDEKNNQELLIVEKIDKYEENPDKKGSLFGYSTIIFRDKNNLSVLNEYFVENNLQERIKQFMREKFLVMTEDRRQYRGFQLAQENIREKNKTCNFFPNYIDLNDLDLPKYLRSVLGYDAPIKKAVMKKSDKTSVVMKELMFMPRINLERTYSTMSTTKLSKFEKEIKSDRKTTFYHD